MSPQQAMTTSGTEPPSFEAKCPDPEPPCAVVQRLVHGQPIVLGLLAGDDDIDVVAAAQAVVGNRQQAVGVRREVHPDDRRPSC